MVMINCQVVSVMGQYLLEFVRVPGGWVSGLGQNHTHYSELARRFQPECPGVSMRSCLLFLCLFLLGGLALAQSPNALGPVHVVGEVPESEQQLIANRLAEILNAQGPLISTVEMRRIQERGYDSADPESCPDRRCLLEVSRFLEDLRDRLKAERIFLPQLVRVGTSSQLMLKQVLLKQPTSIERSATSFCDSCQATGLLQMTDRVALALLGTIPPQDRWKPTAQETSPAAPALPPELQQELDEEPLDLPPEIPLVQEPESDFQEPVDPYVVAQERYNPTVARVLRNLSFNLQVYAIGLSAMVQFAILPDGTAVHPELLASSGSGDFDEAVLSGVSMLQFEPLPEAIARYQRYVVQAQVQNFAP